MTSGQRSAAAFQERGSSIRRYHRETCELGIASGAAAIQAEEIPGRGTSSAKAPRSEVIQSMWGKLSDLACLSAKSRTVSACVSERL